jgi:hypothetical protein
MTRQVKRNLSLKSIKRMEKFTEKSLKYLIQLNEAYPVNSAMGRIRINPF